MGLTGGQGGDDGRVPLGAPEPQLVSVGVQRREDGSPHVAGAQDCHPCHDDLSSWRIAILHSGQDDLLDSLALWTLAGY